MHDAHFCYLCSAKRAVKWTEVQVLLVLMFSSMPMADLCFCVLLLDHNHLCIIDVIMWCCDHVPLRDNIIVVSKHFGSRVNWASGGFLAPTPFCSSPWQPFKHGCQWRSSNAGSSSSLLLPARVRWGTGNYVKSSTYCRPRQTCKHTLYIYILHKIQKEERLQTNKTLVQKYNSKKVSPKYCKRWALVSNC